MSTQRRKIAGFMTAEGIYSLAFYIVMVSAIAGIGAGVMAKKDSAKAASAISLLRANYMAESGSLGYTPAPTGAEIVRMSGNLLSLSGANAVLPGDVATVDLVARGGAAVLAPKGFGINVSGITKPEICNIIAGVGWGTWAAVTSASLSVSAAPVSKTASELKTACAGAAAATAVTLGFLSE